MIVSFTDEAVDDLSSIRAYLSDLNPKAAERTARRLVQAALVN